ncbi:hypothetical protein CW705_04525 [Candidatus Bathyarchaeota archaeon]|nr:MAG: hypothetical protein CW705_04525 [Candidatus Bathyarchaeota archaeon]
MRREYIPEKYIISCGRNGRIECDGTLIIHKNSNEKETYHLVNNIPVKMEKYECGCWGRLHRPHIIYNKETNIEYVEIEGGLGYESNRHLHYQFCNTLMKFKIIDGFILEIFKGGDFIEIRRYAIVRDKDGHIRILQRLPQYFFHYDKNKKKTEIIDEDDLEKIIIDRMIRKKMIDKDVIRKYAKTIVILKTLGRR